MPKGLAQANLNGSAIVVREPGAITSVTDLKNRKVATPTRERYRISCCAGPWRTRASIRDVNEVFMAPPEMLAAPLLLEHRCLCLLGAVRGDGGEQGLGAVLLDSSRIWDNHPCCALVASQDFLKADPEAASALERAHAGHRVHPGQSRRSGADGRRLYRSGRSGGEAGDGPHRLYLEFNVPAIREYTRFLAEQGLVKIDDPDAFVDGFLISRNHALSIPRTAGRKDERSRQQGSQASRNASLWKGVVARLALGPAYPQPPGLHRPVATALFRPFPGSHAVPGGCLQGAVAPARPG